MCPELQSSKHLICEAHNTQHIDHTEPRLACLAFCISQLDLPISRKWIVSFYSEAQGLWSELQSCKHLLSEANHTQHIDHTAPSVACLAFWNAQLDLPISRKCLVSYCSEVHDICPELQSCKHLLLWGTQHTSHWPYRTQPCMFRLLQFTFRHANINKMPWQLM